MLLGGVCVPVIDIKCDASYNFFCFLALVISHVHSDL